MKILVLADIHGEHFILSDILEKEKNYDLIICPGDFTDIVDNPEDFSQFDIANMIIQKILQPRKPVLCIPGNMDPYEILNLFDDYNINLNNVVITKNKIDFIGWGGAQTPFNTTIEPTEQETKQALEKMKTKIKNKTILVVHNPPKNTKLDKVRSGQHVGSQVIRDFIIKEKPILVITAHIHESPGIDKIGNSVLFNSGPLFDGYYGVVTINKEVKCEIKNILKK